MRLTAAITANGLLAYALYRSPPSSKTMTVGLVVIALVIALIGARLGQGKLTRRMAYAHWMALASIVILGILSLLQSFSFFVDTNAYATPSRPLARALFSGGLFVAAVVLLVAVCASYLLPAPVGRGRFAVALAIHVYIGAWWILHHPRPVIDVWQFQQRACALLLGGQNPYGAEYENPYGDAGLFAPQVVKDDKVQGFPYPPLSLFLCVPGYLAGDVRWSMLVAICMSGLLGVAAARRLGLPPGHPAELAVIVLLFYPRSLRVLEMSWTEPFLALATGLAVWAIARHRGCLQATALGMLLTVKQTGILALPGLWVVERPRPRGIAVIGLLALVVTLPFLVWDPEALWRSLVVFHLHSPFRTDTLSVSALVATATGHELSPLWGFAAAVVIGVVAFRGGAMSLSQGALGAAALLLAFFLLNKAAHLNYYWWVAYFLALATMGAAAEAGDSSR
jgi:hypothetical protein